MTYLVYAGVGMLILLGIVQLFQKPWGKYKNTYKKFNDRGKEVD